MVTEREKIEKAKAVLMKIAQGTNPLTGEMLKEDSFLNDPKIIRCFYFVTEILDNVLKGTYSKASKLEKFTITPEQKGQVIFPEGKIGVNEFSKCINMCIDPGSSKKLTGVELNKKLKQIGVLSEGINPATGKMRTIINDNSYKYGFESGKRSYNGIEYEMVLINDKGKRFLLDNIEAIMNNGGMETGDRPGE